MFGRLRQMLIKEFIQVFRDPRMRVVIFVIPTMQTLVIGFAVTTDVRNVRTAVLDRDNSRESRELTSRFTQSGYFSVVEHAADEHRVRELLDRGDVTAVLCMDDGFARELRAGRTADLQVLLDGTDSNTASIVLGYVNDIVGEASREILRLRLVRVQGAVQQPAGVALQTRAWFNENLESRNYYVPGVIVIVVSLITLLLTSMAVVREKEIGTIEQIMVTPIRPAEFILGKTVPFAIIGMIDVLLVTAVGVFLFGVPIRGSIPLLLGCAAVYLMTTLGVGLLISTISQTQQQAMMSVFFFFFPAMLLSGFAFPIANMPEVVQWLTYLDPLRYFLVIVRGIFLKGVGAEILWPQIGALAVMGVTTLTLASMRFRKTL